MTDIQIHDYLEQVSLITSRYVMLASVPLFLFANKGSKAFTFSSPSAFLMH